MSLNPLAADAIRDQLAVANVPAGRFTVEVREQCESTNTTLVELAERGAASGTVLLARHQSGGRGRRGRTWCSAPGASLTFSLLWRFTPGTVPTGLSLAAGVACRRALAGLAASRQADGGRMAPASGLALKWPNDILLDGRKLGGMLIELVPGAPHAVVIGIGLNLQLPASLPADVRDRAAAWPVAIPPESMLVALLGELGSCLDEFAVGGFAALRAEWHACHAYQDRPVRLLDELAGDRQGVCRGVDIDGALLLETETGMERVVAGDVSLREGA